MILQPPAPLAAFLRTGGLVRNGTLSVVQSLVMVGALFLAYRIAIQEVGLERFGIWSLLVAGTALTRLADVSGGAALARFVAEAGPDAARAGRSEIVHTVLLTGLALNALLAAAVAVGAPAALPLLVGPEHLDEARRLVPLAALLVVATGASAAIGSGIDGAHRADLRAACNIAGALAFLAVAWFGVPVLGMAAFGAALLTQHAAVAVLGWLTLRRLVPGLGWVPRRWRAAVFRRTAGYAVRLNAVGVMTILFEPFAKFGFNGIGGPALVALYDIASRPAIQARQLVHAGLVPLVPHFAAAPDMEQPAARRVLRASLRTAAAASVAVTLLLLAGMPLVSLLVLDEISADLLKLSAVMIMGCSLNILVLPLVSAAQGRGVLRWTFLAQTGLAACVALGVAATGPGSRALDLMLFVGGGLAVFALLAFAGNARALGVRDTARRALPATGAAILANALLCGAGAAFWGWLW